MTNSETSEGTRRSSLFIRLKTRNGDLQIAVGGWEAVAPWDGGENGVHFLIIRVLIDSSFGLRHSDNISCAVPAMTSFGRLSIYNVAKMIKVAQGSYVFSAKGAVSWQPGASLPGL